MKSQSLRINDSFIKELYFQEFDNSVDLNSGIIIDDGCFEYIFVDNRDARVSIFHGGENHMLPTSFTLHGMLPPFRFIYEKKLTVMGVKFQPWANSLFIPNSLKLGIIDLADIFGSELNTLIFRLFDEPKLKEFYKTISDLLITKTSVYEITIQMKLVKEVCLEIHQCNGDISVSELAKKYDISRQYLNAVFKESVKYTIKYYSRLTRVRAVLGFAFNNPEIPLTSISHRFGFYDQPHFINECKNLTGVNPLILLKSRCYSLNSF